MPGRSTLLGLASLLALAGLACNPSKSVFQLGLPGTSVDLGVSSAKARMGYLDVWLEGEGWSLRTFLPGSERCTALAQPGAAVQYLASGPYGAVVRGGERCDAIGMGSLDQWRAKQPRGDSAQMIPSARAEYRKLYEDEEVALLRGNFPLGSRVGFTGMGDSIAVVANSPICQRPIGETGGTMEFFPGGRNVLTLSSSDGRCQIEGLIRPLAPEDLEP